VSVGSMVGLSCRPLRCLSNVHSLTHRCVLCVCALFLRQSYIIMSRLEFGDDEQQHLVVARKGKKGVVVAHADFTIIVATFDDDQEKPPGPVMMAVQMLAEAYKEQGY
jgi:hypothetical protein